MDRSTEKTRRLIRTTLAGVLVAMAIAAVACNTVEGAGKDVEDLGEATQDAAN